MYNCSRGVADRSPPRTGAEELAAGGDLSAASADGVIDLVRGEIAEAAARPVVEFGCDVVAVPLGEITEMNALGQILAEEAIGVFVGAAFPGVVRSGEVDLRAECAFQLFIAVELRPVIRSDRSHRMRLGRQELDRAGVGVFDGGTRERANPDQTAFPFNRSNDARLAAAMDGIDLPVTHASAACYDCGPVLDHPFAGKSAAAVVATIALAPALLGSSQISPQRSALRPIPPNVQVDRLVTHHRPAFSSKPTDDLVRAPTLRKQCFHWTKVHRPVARVPAGTAAAAGGHLHRHVRAIRPVIRRGVALHLPRDRAAMTPQCRRDLRRRQSLTAHCCDMISFFGAQLPVCHRPEMSHLLPESKRPNKAPEPTSCSVTPRAIEGDSEMKQRKETRLAARVAPEQAVAVMRTM